MKIKNFTPRLYQQAILNTCSQKNCLIILPTGLGKTKTAILVAIHRLNMFPSSKVLFLTPTKPLAEQIKNEFLESTDIENVVIFTGLIKPEEREKIWNKAKIIVATPQTISNDIINNRIKLEEVSLFCVDEAHRSVGNYDSVWASKQYFSRANFPRIIGLTASPGSEMETINEVCNNLFIEAIEVRTEEDKDVKPYIQELEVKYIEVELPKNFEKIKDYLEDTVKSKLNKLKVLGIINIKGEFATKKHLLSLQKSIQIRISRGEKNIILWQGISLIAELIKAHHALELLETQGIKSAYTYMDGIYSTAEKTKVKATKNLAKDINFKSAFILIEKLYEKDEDHPKINKLKEIVKKEIENNKKIKIIIFNQYRNSADNITKELNKISGAKAKLFVGQTKKGETGLTQKKQVEILEDFKKRKYNCLISTSIGEEGLDIPKVDLVIFYEPIPSAIRTIQRCLIKNTKILMGDNTYKNIQDIKKDDQVITFNEKTRKFENKKVLNCFKTKKQKTIEIKTDLNSNLDLTPNHPIYTKKGWKKAKSIKKGGRIAIPSRYNQKEKIKYLIELCPEEITYVFFPRLLKRLIKQSKSSYRSLAKATNINEKTLWGYANNDAIPLKLFYKILTELNIPLNLIINKIKYIKSRKGNLLKISPKIDKDFMWLCGLIATDGDYGIYSKIRNNRKKLYYTHRFRISNKNKEIIKRVKKIILKLNLRPYIEKNKEGCYSIYSTNTIIGHILKRIGIPSKNKTRKLSISDDIFRMNKENILSYIGGIFDGDGNIELKQGKIRIGTASKSFANKLQKLLLNCGYLSTIKYNKKIEVRNIKGKIAKFNCDFYSIEFYKKHLIKKFIKETNSVRLKNQKINHFFSKKSFYDNNFFWSKVKKIGENKKRDVYNLYIQGNNNYIANNILVHNCGRTARTESGKVIVLVTKKTRDEAYRWTAFNKEKKMYKILDKLKTKIYLERKPQPTLNDFKQEEKTSIFTKTNSLDENKIKIIADSRERGTGILKELVNLGIEVETKNLYSADYVINNVGIELKTKEDFLESIIDKRLIHQLRELKNNFEKQIIIIQGTEDIYSLRRIHPNAIRGMLATIALSYNIPIIYTRDPKDTAALLLTIAKREQDIGKKDFSIRQEKKPLTLKEQQEYIVESLPGVGPLLAKSLLKKFKSVKKIINAKEEKLQKVEKIGKVKAKEIRKVIEEEYKN